MKLAFACTGCCINNFKSQTVDCIEETFFLIFSFNLTCKFMYVPW